MPGAGQGQVQMQREAQVQRLLPQQYLLSHLIELPIAELEQRVRDELYENVALEEGRDAAADDASNLEGDDGTEQEFDDFDPTADNDRDDTLLTSLSDYDDDELPNYSQAAATDNQRDIPIGDTRSFIDDLRAQMSDYDLSDQQQQLVDYLIGSLDERGFVDRPLRNIADDLLFNHNIDVTEDDLLQALHVLQQFDPVGIGARNLQECLLLQIQRQTDVLNASAIVSGVEKQGRLQLLRLEHDIVAHHYSAFEHKDFDKISAALHLTPHQLRQAFEAIGRLNPHPGLSLHEAADDRAQTIIPDFIVETDRESSIHFYLNNGEVPALHVGREYVDQLRQLQNHSSGKLSRTHRDALIYTRQKVESAQMFIAAIRQRQQTLHATMQTIIDMQRDFFLSQDDRQLRPLRLTDVAQRTHLDVSTISRVVSSKYALVDGVLYPLKFFFLRSNNNSDGHALLHTVVHPLLEEIIAGEDKSNPLTDQQISQLLAEKGERVSRRTVSKYRDLLGIPSALLRKEI